MENSFISATRRRGFLNKETMMNHTDEIEMTFTIYVNTTYLVIHKK